jgi:L-threonylcarbamoyladenylate synthase
MIDDISNCLEVLKKGGIILYPTDTIWGIGCDATNQEAVNKIYEIKKRDLTQSMLILVDQPARLHQYVDIVPDIALDLVELTDKPLTIIYPKAKNLATNLLPNDGSIGIRVTSDEFCQKLIFQFRKPIVSTSANFSGKPSPANFSEIEDELKSQVDYVVKWRQNEKSKAKASGIIKVGVNGEIKVIRK